MKMAPFVWTQANTSKRWKRCMHHYLLGEQPNDKVLLPLLKEDKMHIYIYTLLYIYIYIYTLLEENNIEIYKSLIGSMQWTVSI